VLSCPRSVHDLLGGPSGHGMFRDVGVDDAPAVVGEHDEDDKDVQAGGGHGEESIETLPA